MAILELIVLLAGVAVNEQAPPVNLAVWSVQARLEGRDTPYYGPGLEPIQNELGGLHFNSFYLLASGRFPAPFGQETRISANPIYTLIVSPVSREEDGRVRLDIRIEMTPKAPGEKPIAAVSTRVLLAPGSRVKLGGMRLDQGELVLVIQAN